MNLIQPSYVLPNRVRIYPADDVTSRSSDEVDPREVGMEPEQVERIWRSVVYYYLSGVHPAMALCIRHRGKVILDRTIGHARGNGPDDPAEMPRVLATPDTAFNLFSCTKLVTAMLIHSLVERRKLRYDDHVVEYIPEFGAHGKGSITIRHLLTHRAGIPFAREPESSTTLMDKTEDVIARICALKPEYRAGRTVAYHALTAGFLLGEIVRRVTGEGIRALLQKTVRSRLGFRYFTYGVQPEEIEEVARDSFTGNIPRGPLRVLLKRALGLDMDGLIEALNDHRFITGVVPSGNLFATANEVCRFMELLLRGGKLGRVRLFKAQTIRTALAEQVYYELDRTLLLPLRYSMGFMLGGDRLSLFGRQASRAFGHVGFTNVMAWADPERELSVSLMNNGKPLFTPEALLWFNIVRVISEEVPRDGNTNPDR